MTYTYHVYRIEDDFELWETFSFYYVTYSEERVREIHKYYHPDCHILSVKELSWDTEILFYDTPEHYPYHQDEDDEDFKSVLVADIVEYHNKAQTSGLVCTSYEG